MPIQGEYPSQIGSRSSRGRVPTRVPAAGGDVTPHTKLPLCHPSHPCRPAAQRVLSVEPLKARAGGGTSSMAAQYVRGLTFVRGCRHTFHPKCPPALTLLHQPCSLPPCRQRMQLLFVSQGEGRPGQWQPQWQPEQGGIGAGPTAACGRAQRAVAPCGEQAGVVHKPSTAAQGIDLQGKRQVLNRTPLSAGVGGYPDLQHSVHFGPRATAVCLFSKRHSSTPP